VRDPFERVKHLAKSRRAAWAAVAVLCVTVGTVGSVLAAHAVARTGAAKARLAFQLSSTEVASTLKLAIQHQEAVTASAGTFFASRPDASPAEFQAWVKSARPLGSYPALDKLSLIALVHAPELAAFQARISGHPLKPAASKSKAPAAAGPKINPAGTRPYYCLAAGEVAKHAVPGLDYCALAPGTLPLLRDTGQSSYVAASAGRSKALVVETPVYDTGAPARTQAARTAAFVGWVREVLLPGVLLEQALKGHPENAVSLRPPTGPPGEQFTAGSPREGAQSSTTDLGNGWVLQSFGAPAGADVFADGSALAHLIGGILLSVLLGLLVFLLGSGRSRRQAPKGREVLHADLYDPLTGLPNRALMLDRAELTLARAGRQSEMLAGALFIDIDGFKDVNEKLGQAAGDQLLTIVAERLEDVVRAGDTVGRLGGDEFVVLVESKARGIRLDSLARRVIAAMHKPLEVDNFPSFFLTASIGIAFGRYATAEDLLRDAQLALYSAKSAGRDRYTLFNANMRSVIEGRGLLEDELKSALQGNQFSLLYQPTYDLRTQKVVSLEALIRWDHPTQGELPPNDFIPLAEETGLIVPIGRWQLEEACTRAAAWNVAGRRVGISVKVSSIQLSRDGFSTDVRRALLQSGLEPPLLTLEISEATMMRDISASAERIEELKQLGVRVAIGDFGGNGYAHHSELRGMSVDLLMVDRDCIAESDGEDYRSWLLEAILNVGRDLSIGVVAKGVESHEQLAALQQMGYTMAQGFLMGKPTPVTAVEELFGTEFPRPSATSASVAQ